MPEHQELLAAWVAAGKPPVPYPMYNNAEIDNLPQYLVWAASRIPERLDWEIQCIKRYLVRLGLTS